MLAQNFKTPADLKIDDEDFEALVKVLGMFERCEVPGRLFRMAVVGAPECGAAGCICGWARSVNPKAFRGNWKAVTALFVRPPHLQLKNAMPAQGAIAIRNFLTFGDPRWDEAMAE